MTDQGAVLYPPPRSHAVNPGQSSSPPVAGAASRMHQTRICESQGKGFTKSVMPDKY